MARLPTDVSTLGSMNISLLAKRLFATPDRPASFFPKARAFRMLDWLFETDAVSDTLGQNCTLEVWNIHKAENIVGAMHKNDGDNLAEWLPSDLPEDPVIRADSVTRISRGTDGKNGPDDTVVTKARLHHNLLKEQDKADAAVDSEPSMLPSLLVLYVLSMLILAGYALARAYIL